VLDLHSAAGLPEGPLDEVAVADTGPVLGREPQVDGERGEIVGDTGDRRRIAGLPLGGERDGLALGNGDRLIAGLGLANVKDRPEVGLTSAWSWTDTLARVLRARWACTDSTWWLGSIGVSSCGVMAARRSAALRSFDGAGGRWMPSSSSSGPTSATALRIVPRLTSNASARACWVHTCRR